MIDSVRASRDGHEFHEAWTARRALQLLLPSDDLHAIAVEGLSSPDNQRAAAASVEIADLTLYYGHFHTFETAKRVVILQFKYSIRDERVVFRMSDAKKTIQKFAAAYTDHKTRFGVEPVERKLEFTLVTNRPLYGAFESAVQAIARGQALKGEAEKQAKQFERACGFKATELRDFAKKISVTGLTRNLSDSKRDLSTTLVDWSAASDTIAGARLNKIKQLVRDKAG
ncbi:MAG TPA: hypothetical protein VLV88_03930, partial [Terriglobales bacterium]|nr:hypothetical protein [Terriglobales bacterium]